MYFKKREIPVTVEKFETQFLIFQYIDYYRCMQKKSVLYLFTTNSRHIPNDEFNFPLSLLKHFFIHF